MVTASAAAASRRNAGTFVATVAGVGLLMLYPTSTNGGASTRRPGQPVAPAGVVSSGSAQSGGGTSSGGTSGGRTTAAPKSTTPIRTVVVNGTSVPTQYGPVQVQIAVRNKRIVRATAIDYPQAGGRDIEINSRAIPLLQQETVQAQSVHIDTISGATFTSEGYLTSLQAALDAAHLG